VTIGLILAVILAERKRSRLFYATIYFIPITVAAIMAAVVWGWIYSPTFGALNKLLGVVGLEMLQRKWLGDPDLALLSVNMIGNWGYFGFCTLIFLAGIQNIDPTLFDAARCDGANAIQKFFHITLPSIRNTIFFVIVYTIIGSMKFFDLIYVATKGGPNHASQIVGGYMFDLFIRQGEVNYAASMSVVLTGIILLLSIFVIRYFYEKHE
jgi:ABC-type sugar transport system permease subunit